MYGKGLKTANEWGKETNIEILYKQEFQEANEGKNNKKLSFTQFSFFISLKWAYIKVKPVLMCTVFHF